jgi:hypothetical protein
MSENPTPVLDQPPANGADPVPEGIDALDGSILADLKQRHRQIVESKSIVIPIPGYAGKLACRYKRIGIGEERSIVRRAVAAASEGDEDADFHSWTDQLINACEEIVVPGERSGTWESLHPTRPVRYGDPRLVAALELDVEEDASVRKKLLALFGGEGHELAVSAHHDRYIAWLRGNGEDNPGAVAEAEDEFAGE